MPSSRRVAWVPEGHAIGQPSMRDVPRDGEGTLGLHRVRKNYRVGTVRKREEGFAGHDAEATQQPIAGGLRKGARGR